MWWNCFSSRSTNRRPNGRKIGRRPEEDEGHREGNSANHHTHISFAEVNEPGALLPMPSEDIVNERFTKIVVSCTRTS